MTKQQLDAIQALDDANAHFHLNGGDEKPATKLTVRTSSDGNGSHIDAQDAFKAYLSERGFFEQERDFDRQCGKGFQIFVILGMKGKN